VPASIGSTVVRVVGPPIYRGAVAVTPSDQTQTLQTKDKLVREDITVTGITGTQTITENGEYNVVGDKLVTVDVEPNLETLSVTENGLYLPESGTDGFDRVNVDVPQPSGSMTITENGTYDVTEFAEAVVDVPPAISIDGICTGVEPSGNIVVNADTIRDYVFRHCTITGIDAPNCTYLGNENFRNNTNLTFAHFPKCTEVGGSAFQGSRYGYDSDFITDFPKVETIHAGAFRDCNFRKVIFPETLKSMSESYTFLSQIKDRVHILTEVYFRSKVTGSIHAQCFGTNNNLRDIYVPWSQGEVANAPWGATNATIHYNTVYDDDWNVISST